MAYPGYPACYYIRSRLNGLVLDIEGGSTSPCTRVITWSQNPGQSNNQLWYDDPATGTIRSKLHNFCLDFNGSNIVVTPFSYGNPNQLWERADPFIRMRMQPNRVLDVANNNTSPGAYLVAWDGNGQANQCFDIQYVAGGAAMPSAPIAQAARPQSYFYIVSDMHGKVLDIEGGSSGQGARVIVWGKKGDGSRNQLWYADYQGIIRSALNDFALTAKHGGDQVHMMPFSNDHHQQWRLAGNRVTRSDGECLDIAGQNYADGANVVSYGYKGSANQHWHIEYA